MIENKLSFFLLIFTLLLVCTSCKEATEFQGNEISRPLSPKTYIIYKISDPLNIDGKLEEETWQNTEWTDPFLDIQGDELPAPRFETRAKMLWDDDYLYIAAQLEEPHIWATIEQRDAVIFMENNFEVFIDPDGDTHNYYELEVNALGTFWDLMLTKPYRNGGRPLNSWDIKGLKIGIDIQGTLNDPTDTDQGWSLELAISMDVLNQTIRRNQPEDGSQWRLNFSRVEWRTEVKDGAYVKQINPDTGNPFPEDNWVWSPQGVINMHVPEMWGIVQFSDDPPGSSVQFSHSGDLTYEWVLRELYNRQRSFFGEYGTYAEDLDQLNTAELFSEYGIAPDVQVSILDNTFTMSLTTDDLDHIFYIREDSRSWKELK